MHPSRNSLKLTLPGYEYDDLFVPEKLAALTGQFDEDFRAADPDLFSGYEKYRVSAGEGFSDIEGAALLVRVAPHLSRFVARLFGVENECKALQREAGREQVIFLFKKEFVVRRVLKKFSKESTPLSDAPLLGKQAAALRRGFAGLPDGDEEFVTAAMVVELLEHDRYAKTSLPPASQEYVKTFAAKISAEEILRPLMPASSDEQELRRFLSAVMSVFERLTAAYFHDPHSGKNAWVSFRLPRAIDYFHLVDFEEDHAPASGGLTGPAETLRRRDGFDLTDPRFTRRDAMNEVDYCIFCHDRGKDSCSKGIKDGNTAKTNPLGYPLNGCPLGQKISESHALEQQGDIIAALALIVVDNPMVPGTGHRICNDCMKACIYQKQDPVNIPQIETRILNDVLDLPWGFEIYSLLTRWNPLNASRPHALPYNGLKILVVGMGPAGYTLAHYFLNEGFGVVGIDGLKIEPLPPELAGDRFAPVRDINAIRVKLSDRTLMGFGGVSEYGITVRWDKNFLTVLYLNLIRREHFRVYGGVRFGGTMDVDDAWRYGFHHVCIATGAGKPTFVAMKNNLIRGIRKASDFLMALQLTGAGKRDSLANLQVQLPAIVIGGGLTAIDTATELMAYYPVQVERISGRYNALADAYGKSAIDVMFDPEELALLEQFLGHASAIAGERSRAAAAGEQPDFISLVRRWGGVHVYYRKAMTDSPAYRLNHEEIIKGLEEGFTFVERMSPLEAVSDERGALKEVVFERMALVDGKWKSDGGVIRVRARAMMVAAGTVPNVMYEREHPGTFALDARGEYFQSHGQNENGGAPEQSAKKDSEFFTSYSQGGRRVTFYGDNHPVYAGNVVKAMASAKAGYRSVLALLRDDIARSGAPPSDEWRSFAARLDGALLASVASVTRLTPTIVEVAVSAPDAARKFQPGQFYRLQTFERDAPRLENTLMMMEGIALTGAWVDSARGIIGLIALEVGASSRMVSMLKEGQRVIVMGPTGEPTEITSNGTVLLLGGGLGNAVLFSIAKAFKEKNNRVIYFAGYKKKEDFFKRDEIESSTDVVVYSVDAGEPIEARRPQDKSFVGNIVQSMLAYARGELGAVPAPLKDAGRIIAIGSDRMMAAVTQARHGVLKPYLDENHVGIASINSPMQCMMKAVCAQCLQRHVDPETGREEFVFTCVNQDQMMDRVDFGNLNSRLRANTLSEKITNRWLEHVREKHRLERV